MLGISFLFATLSEVGAAKRKLSHILVVAEPELARAIARRNWQAARQLSQSLYFADLQTLSIKTPSELVYAFPNEAAVVDQCPGVVSETIHYHGNNIAEVNACVSLTAVFRNIIAMPHILWGALSIALLTALAAVLPLARYRMALMHSISLLKQWAHDETSHLPEAAQHDVILEELLGLVRIGLRKEVSTERSQLRAQARQELGELSSQIAHDIKSPLAALDVVMRSAGELPEELRYLVRASVTRIRDITHELLCKHRDFVAMEQVTDMRVSTPTPYAKKDASFSEPTLVSCAVEQVISEKRAAYRGCLKVDIDGHLDESCYGLFVKMGASTLKRVLSNLLDNAIEAVDGAGTVNVEHFASEKEVYIIVTDDGSGIASHTLPKLMQPGATFGKEHGNGLGLYHARQACEACGGRLSIESSEGNGTCVTIALPRATPPGWFLPRLNMQQVNHCVIVDDDDAVHTIWSSRLGQRKNPNAEIIYLVHLKSPEELRQWHAHHDSPSVKYLVDYEFMGTRENGLSLIGALAIGERSVLVTSHSEETIIHERCVAQQVTLIPKNIVAYVPLGLSTAYLGLSHN